MCVFRCDQHEPGAPEADGTGAGVGGQQGRGSSSRKGEYILFNNCFSCGYSALTGLVVLQGKTTTGYRRVIKLI